MKNITKIALLALLIFSTNSVLAQQNVEENEVFPVEVINEVQIKKPLENNNQIICPFCNSKFGIIIGISSIKCPVCQERIDL